MATETSEERNNIQRKKSILLGRLIFLLREFQG
jgi:hypothetical protein